jgi:hypothetical protein
VSFFDDRTVRAKRNLGLCTGSRQAPGSGLSVASSSGSPRTRYSTAVRDNGSDRSGTCAQHQSERGTESNPVDLDAEGLLEYAGRVNRIAEPLFGGPP